MTPTITKRTTTLSDGRELIYFDDADTTLGDDRSVDSRTLDPRPATATMRPENGYRSPQPDRIAFFSPQRIKTPSHLKQRRTRQRFPLYTTSPSSKTAPPHSARR